MARLVSAARLAALGLLPLVAACSGNLDFSITKPYDANSAGAPAVYANVIAVDLPADAPDAWKHRNKIKSLDLVGIDGTIDALVGAAPPAGTTGSGYVKIRADGAPADGSADVVVGSWPSEAFPTAFPQSLGVVLPGAAIDVINDALRGSGKFSIVVAGATSNPVHFTGTVTLHLKLKYKVP